MPKRTNTFQRIVTLLNATLSDKAKVVESAMLKDKVTQKEQEVDVLITTYAATIMTIREKILKTAAVIKELKTRIKIEMPSSCITKKLQMACYDYFALGYT